MKKYCFEFKTKWSRWESFSSCCHSAFVHFIQRVKLRRGGDGKDTKGAANSCFLLSRGTQWACVDWGFPMCVLSHYCSLHSPNFILHCAKHLKCWLQNLWGQSGQPLREEAICLSCSSSDSLKNCHLVYFSLLHSYLNNDSLCLLLLLQWNDSLLSPRMYSSKNFGHLNDHINESPYLSVPYKRETILRCDHSSILNSHYYINTWEVSTHWSGHNHLWTPWS